MTVIKKKKNPQDATLRNLTALKKRVALLEKEVKKLRKLDEHNKKELAEWEKTIKMG